MCFCSASGPEDEEGPGPWVINGAWLFRGQDFLAEMKEENPDSEYYTWTKVRLIINTPTRSEFVSLCILLILCCDLCLCAVDRWT